MYFIPQTNQILERLMNHALDHFRIDPNLNAMIISYKEKECEVFSPSIERIYSEAFEAYQEETNHYQEMLHRLEELTEAYISEKSVTAEELTHHQQLIEQSSPREYGNWYKEVIIDIIKDDKKSFEKALDTMFDN